MIVMRNKIILWRFIALLGWGLILGLVLLLGISAYLYGKSTKASQTEFFGGYQVTWGVFSDKFELSQNGQVLEKFSLPAKPLAVWYRPSTRTAAVITSEFANGAVTDNQVLYLWKNQTLRKLYHAVVGFNTDQKKWLNSSLYQVNGLVDEQASAVYLTPNEEYLFGREYGYGYSARVFRVGVNGLISGSNQSLQTADLHWSPTGQCLINLGSDHRPGWGYFARPDDFVYYNSDGVEMTNLRNLQVWWKNEAPCEGYVSFMADHFGGEGDVSVMDETYHFVFGEGQGEDDQIGYRRLKALPKGIESFPKSLQDDWQLVMVTRR